MPLGLLLLLAAGLVFPAAGGGHGQAAHGGAAGQVAHFGIASEVADDDDFVDGCHEGLSGFQVEPIEQPPDRVPTRIGDDEECGLHLPAGAL